MSSLLTNSDSKALAHHVLVVEDNQDVAESIKALLESRGHRVTIAKDGGQAHSNFVMRKPDFVLLDLILPGEHGFDVCEHLKQVDEHVPVLILSAIDMDDARRLAERIGADGYMTKPFDAEQLVARIQSVAQSVWERFHLGRNPKEESRVRFACGCGKRFKVSPVHRGRTLTCPDCGETLIVPRHA